MVPSAAPDRFDALRDRKIHLTECWARDGLQSLDRVIPVKDKLAILDQIIAASFDEVEVTSFVPARTTPQFEDAEEVLASLHPAAGVRLRVLAPNLKGVERACAAKAAGAPIDTVGFPISASQAHNLANLRMNHEQHLNQLGQSIPLILDAGLEPVAAVATAFGCPLSGAVDRSVVLSLARWLRDQGVRRIMLSDTTGLGDPVSVSDLLMAARAELPDVEFIAHFHDTRGSGLVNTLAAVLSGANTIETSLGGIGGEPSAVEQNHAGETGNVATEDAVVLLARCGAELAVDPHRVESIGRDAERVLGRPARSQILRSGSGLDKQERHDDAEFMHG